MGIGNGAWGTPGRAREGLGHDCMYWAVGSGFGDPGSASLIIGSAVGFTGLVRGTFSVGWESMERLWGTFRV